MHRYRKVDIDREIIDWKLDVNTVRDIDQFIQRCALALDQLF